MIEIMIAIALWCEPLAHQDGWLSRYHHAAVQHCRDRILKCMNNKFITLEQKKICFEQERVGKEKWE